MRDLTCLDELDNGLAPPVAVLHIAGVVSQVTLLQSVNAQRDSDLLLPQVLADRPARDDRKPVQFCSVFALAALPWKLKALVFSKGHKLRR